MWKVGEEAISRVTRTFSHRHWCSGAGIKKGGIYIVREVRKHPVTGEIGLVISPKVNGKTPVFFARHFRKPVVVEEEVLYTEKLPLAG